MVAENEEEKKGIAEEWRAGIAVSLSKVNGTEAAFSDPGR